MLARKIPVLATLPQNGGSKGRKNKFILSIENRVQKISVFFEKQIFLHKFLLWIKIIVVKIETKIDSLLHKVRRRAQEVSKKLTDKK